MKALTVRQPWADAIAHGSKRTENRSWKLPAKHVSTRILIHAAVTTDKKAVMPADCGIDRAFGSIPIARHGAIIAVATLAGCHFDTGCCEPWGMADYYHWEFADVTALPEPVMVKGALGLWAPAADILDVVTAQTAVTT